MTVKFKEFLNKLVLESLHPEIQDIVKEKTTNRRKQDKLAKKIKELHERGEKTGIEGNMPQGSSRAYLQHEEHEPVTLDGQKHHLKVGTKVAIRAPLDPHHEKQHYNGMSLGQLQNEAEGGDHYVNSHYRVLTKDHETGHYHTNHQGIFPPLVDHDDDKHEWSKVGHARDLKKDEFQKLTKTDSHPNGISHTDFCEALERNHNRNHGRYHKTSAANEKRLDHIDSHPLVQKFQDYHDETGHPPHDYRQEKNMGVFEHPNGSKHIVARDHGFSTDVANAYFEALQNKSEKAAHLRKQEIIPTKTIDSVPRFHTTQRHSWET